MNLFAVGPTRVERLFLAGEDYKELEVFETPTCLGTWNWYGNVVQT